MEPNVDRGMWSVVVLLAAIVIGGVVLLAFPRISGKIANSMDDTVNKAFSGEMPAWTKQGDEVPVTFISKEFKLGTAGNNVNRTFAKMEKSLLQVSKEYSGGVFKVYYDYEITTDDDHFADKDSHIKRHTIQFHEEPYTITGGKAHDYHPIKKGRNRYRGETMFSVTDHLSVAKNDRDYTNIGIRVDNAVVSVKINEIKIVVFKEDEYKGAINDYKVKEQEIMNRFNILPTNFSKVIPHQEYSLLGLEGSVHWKSNYNSYSIINNGSGSVLGSEGQKISLRFKVGSKDTDTVLYTVIDPRIIPADTKKEYFVSVKVKNIGDNSVYVADNTMNTQEVKPGSSEMINFWIKGSKLKDRTHLQLAFRNKNKDPIDLIIADPIVSIYN